VPPNSAPSAPASAAYSASQGFRAGRAADGCSQGSQGSRLVPSLESMRDGSPPRLLLPHTPEV